MTLYDFCTDGDCETCDLVPTEGGRWMDAGDYALLSDAYAMLENEIVGLRVAVITALAAAERELEGVKRVEAWLMQQPLTHYITRNYDGHYEATAAGRVVPNTEAQSPTLAALGHALPNDTTQEGR